MKTPKARPRDTGRNAQLERTLNILRELERTGGLTLAQLSDKFGTTERTIRRDLEALQAAGFALSGEADDKRKRWKLEANAQARRLSALLDKSHLLALRLAMGQGGALRRSDTVFSALEDLSDKVAEALGPRSRKQLESFYGCFHSYEKHAYREAAPDVLWGLVDAIERRRVCRITYRKPQRELQDKTFEILPLRIFAHQGAAYLMCQVLKHDSLGTLNLQRVKHLRILDKQAEVPAGFDPEQLEAAAFGVHTGGVATPYVLRFDATVAAYIRERKWHPSQRVHELPEGGVELSFTCGNSWEVSAWVASWRHWVEVVEPQALRAELRELGARLVEQYRDVGSPAPRGGHGKSD